MKGICDCGKPAQTSLSYRFTAPSGYKCVTDILACKDCGPVALREVASQLQAWADVMEKVSIMPQNPPPEWVPTEEDWDKFSMILDEQRLRHVQESCKPGDKFLWRYLMLWGNRSPEPKEDRDAHTEHCCIIHGCKYNNEDCPVVLRKKVQSGYCETCGLELEENS